MTTKTSANLIKAFNLAKADIPKHPLLLSNLINELIDLKEYYDAERYARMYYKQSTQHVDTENLEVSNAAELLAEAVSMLYARHGPKKFDILEAEVLSRKALRIIERIYGRTHIIVNRNLSTLSEILNLKEGHDAERKCLLERCLASGIQNNSTDSDDIAIGNHKLAMLHFKIAAKMSPASITRTEKLLIAKSYSDEAVRITTKINGPTHFMTITYIASLSKILELINEE
jgi:hypothetical protein